MTHMQQKTQWGFVIGMQASNFGFFPVFTQVRNTALWAFWCACDTNIATMQNEPVVGVELEFWCNKLFEAFFNGRDILAGCDARAIRYPENVRIDCDRGMSKSRIEYNICCFSTHAGQGFKRLTVLRDFTLMLFKQDLAGGNDVLCLGFVKSNSSNERCQTLLA